MAFDPVPHCEVDVLESGGTSTHVSIEHSELNALWSASIWYTWEPLLAFITQLTGLVRSAAAGPTPTELEGGEVHGWQ